MATTTEPSDCPDQTSTLLVLLPGAYSAPQEFVDAGFGAAVRERGLAVDVLRVDAHLGYYDNAGSLLLRLDQDVIRPARARGYRSIWLAGISIGGFGSLAYAASRPGEVAGVIVLAPYLGERLTSTVIDNAGGLAQWRSTLPTPDAGPRERRELQLWQWLQAYATTPAERPPLWLGYGVDDRFAFSHRLLAAVLPADHVATTPGGHDWPEWSRLWGDLLPRLPLPGCKP